MTSRPETAIVPAGVALPVSVAHAVQQMREYQELTQQLLEPSDYQMIGGKKFKKKSAWRKYGRAFNISDQVVSEEIQRSDDGFPVFARIRVRAMSAGGRSAEADHECHVSEKCCPAARASACEKRHDHCPGGCDGRVHWSHPGDIPATATTRAKNRAISDLIGAGEVSAEELDGSRRGGSGWDEDDSPHGVCRIHRVPYIMKGKMRSPAHKIKDSDNWCNKPSAHTLAVALLKERYPEPAAQKAWLAAAMPDLAVTASAAYTADDWQALLTALEAPAPDDEDAEPEPAADGVGDVPPDQVDWEKTARAALASAVPDKAKHQGWIALNVPALAAKKIADFAPEDWHAVVDAVARASGVGEAPAAGVR